MGKVLKDLALALVNATLILVAVCLFLAWQLSRTVEGLLANAAGQLQVVEPLRARMAETRAELAGLRADLAALAAAPGDLAQATLARIETRAAAIDARLDATQARLAALEDAPRALLDQAIATSAAAFSQSVIAIRNCTPPAPGDLPAVLPADRQG